jgi:hypothetical protein
MFFDKSLIPLQHPAYPIAGAHGIRKGILLSDQQLLQAALQRLPQ